MKKAAHVKKQEYGALLNSCLPQDIKNTLTSRFL